MAAPLTLAMRITADSTQVVSAGTASKAAVEGIGAAADVAAARTAAMTATLSGSSAASDALADAMRGAQVAMQAAAEAMTAAAAASQRQAAADEALRARADAAVAAEGARAEALRQRAEATRLAREEATRLAAEEAAAQASARYAADMQARYVDGAAAAQRYKAALVEIRAAEQAGALTSAQAAVAIGRTKSEFAEQVRAAKAGAAGLSEWQRTGRLAGWQASQLSYQLNDVVVSLASGMNPLTVAIQQGSQIAPLFGGIRGTAQALLSVLTIGRVALGGLTGAVILGAGAWSDYDASMRAAQAAATGLGRGLGVTAGDIDALAQSSADVAGLSVSAARSMATGFVSTGKIGGDLYGGLISIARDFAVTVGATSEEAGAKLAEIFADPAKGAAALHAQYGLIDGATARYVARLAEQGRAEDARLALLAALPPQLAKARDATNEFASSWDGVARAASNAWDWIGRAINRAAGGGTAAEQIARLRAEIEQLEFTAAAPLNPNAGDAAARLIGKRAELARLTRADADRQAEEVRAKAMRAADDKASRGAAVAAALPDLDGQRGLATLRDQQRALREGLANGALGSERQAQATALNAVTRAIETYIPPAEKAARLQQIDLQVMQARDPVTKANLAAERARVELAGQVVTAADAQAAAERARNQVMGETLATSSGQIATMRQEIAARRAVNDAVEAGRLTAAEAQRQMQIEAELRPLIVAHAQAEGATKADLTLIIQSLRDAYADLAAEEKRAAGIEAVQAGDKRIERLRLEQSLVGASAAARAKALAAADVEAEIRDKGLTGDLADKRRAQAAAEAALAATLERQRNAWSTLADVGSSALDELTDAIVENGLSMETLGDIGKAVAADLIKAFAELAVINPLKNVLLGTSGGTLSDVGGIVGGIVNGKAANDNAGAIAKIASGAATAAAQSAGPAVTPTAVGLNADFAAALDAMRSDAAKAGYDIGITSGYRSVARQQELWDAALNKYGSAEAARKWVAPPGSSYHNGGIAADLKYGSDAARRWAHDNAADYGLNYPLPNEAWHIEPTSARTSGAATSAAEAIDRMASSAGRAGDATSSLASGLTDTAAGLTDSAHAISTSAAGAASAGSDMADAAAQTATSADGAFETLLGGLGSMIDQFFGAISGALTGLLDLLSAGNFGGGNLLSSLASGLGSLFGVPARAGGGWIRGPGTGTSDSIPARLSDGEFVVRAAVARQHGAFLEALNSGSIRHFAAGGTVARAAASMPATLFASPAGVGLQASVAGTDARSYTITIGAGAGVTEAQVRDIVRRASDDTLRAAVSAAPAAVRRERQATRGR